MLNIIVPAWADFEIFASLYSGRVNRPSWRSQKRRDWGRNWRGCYYCLYEKTRPKGNRWQTSIFWYIYENQHYNVIQCKQSKRKDIDNQIRGKAPICNFCSWYSCLKWLLMWGKPKGNAKTSCLTVIYLLHCVQVASKKLIKKRLRWKAKTELLMWANLTRR